jgi:IS1 family transposase
MLAIGCILVHMNQLNSTERAQVVRALVEGNSIRSICRMYKVGKNTVARLLVQLGKACSDYQSDVLRNLPCMVVQVDELWSFVGCKEKRTTPDKKADGQGDCWTWTALDADSKLMITWHMGGRGPSDCEDFMFDLADRLKNRIQLSSDGHGAYKNAVRLAFGPNVDYGQVIKVFGVDAEGEKRYSPAECTACKTKAVIGDPMDSQISTSYVERSNLTMRMGCRRFTRLTNAFSKKLENHAHATALHFMYYNFGRPHMTLTKEKGAKTTPAMAAGVTDHVWSVEEIVGLLG